MDVIRLTERRSRRARLARPEAAWLRAFAHGVVEVMPDERPGVYRLTAGGYVGTLFTPGRPVEIGSRVPNANLPWLLGADGPPAGDGWGPFDAVALTLAQRLDAVACGGLWHEYRETSHAGAALVGRLDPTAQAREARRDTLHSRPDDRSAQLPCNAVPAGLARRLLSAALRDDVRARLRAALSAWDAVASADGPLPDDVPPGYGPLFEACAWLLAGPGDGASSPLLDLGRAFEGLVARTLGGVAQRTVTVCPADGRRPALSVRPDVTGPTWAADAKWKSRVETADVYQAVAYGTALGVTRVALVYPGRRRGWAWDVGPVRVRLVWLDVSGSEEACRRSAERLRRAVG